MTLSPIDHFGYIKIQLGSQAPGVGRVHLYAVELGLLWLRGYQATSKCGQQCSHDMHSTTRFYCFDSFDLEPQLLCITLVMTRRHSEISSFDEKNWIRLHFKMSSWQPNPNAKPFTPASAYFTLPIPCKKIRIRKKGILSRIIQWILVIVLCVTVVINFIFIWDTTKKYSRDRNGLNANTADDRISQLERSERTGMVFKANLNLNRLKYNIYKTIIHLR